MMALFVIITYLGYLGCKKKGTLYDIFVHFICVLVASSRVSTCTYIYNI